MSPDAARGGAAVQQSGRKPRGDGGLNAGGMDDNVKRVSGLTPSGYAAARSVIRVGALILIDSVSRG